MSFLDHLKKTFIYTGNTDTKVTEGKTSNVVNDNVSKNISMDIGNPIKRIKQIKQDIFNDSKVIPSVKNRVLSNYTKNLVYKAIHMEIEQEVNKGKPVEEATLLYKKFLEDKIIEESYYSDEDMEYIKSLVRYIKRYKSLKEFDSSLSDIKESIENSKYFLSIVEVLDTIFEFRFMDYFCEHSYIVCGYNYNESSNDLLSSDILNIPTFKLNIHNSSYTLLKEVNTLISDDSSIEDRERYIINKLSPFFSRYVDINNVPIKLLYSLLSIFNNISDTPVIKKEVEDTTPLIDNISTPATPIDELKIDAELTEEEFMSRVFNGITESVEKESKLITLYGPLVDSRNPNVTIDDIREAISDFKNVMTTCQLKEEEFKIYSTLNSRLRLLEEKDDWSELND